MHRISYLLGTLWHREVEDFTRRLNSDWPERMQEFFSSGQERKTMVFTTYENGSLRRNACMPFSGGFRDFTYTSIIYFLFLSFPAPFNVVLTEKQKA